VGSGPLEGQVRAEAARLGVNLQMTGFMNQSELGEMYALADCLVLPSAYPETWGLVVNEALAAGLPCVVSSAAGCAPDLIRDDETGYVFPLDDGPALIAALSRVRDRRAAGHDWRAACQAHVARYSFPEMTKGLVRAARSVLRRSRAAEPRPGSAPCRIIACCGQMVIAGGLERMTFEALDAARAGGAAVHAIVNGWENFRITALAENSGASWSVGPYWYPFRRRRLTVESVVKMIVEVLRVSGNLLRVARRIGPTHIFMPDFETVLRNAPALVWLRAGGARVVLRLGNAPSPGGFYERLWRHGIARLVDRFVVNSDFTRRALLAVGIDEGRIQMIANMPARRPNGVAAAPVAPIPGRLIFVGQIIPEKGLDLLLDALALVRARGLDATLDVVGALDGWESPTYAGHRAAIRERARRDDLAGAVRFLGWREDVPDLLRRASLHCCPSRPEQRESFGNVVLEAKVSGVASLVTPSGSLPEVVVHRRDGWICGEPTAAALAEGIQYFLSQPGVLAEAGGAARRSAAHYSADRFAAAWRDLFAQEQYG
jgi:glycosyltransferase involved in cell wall biosynthesis